MERKTAIIIGAGPAGLTAAYQILKTAPNIHPIILEESAEIGGISRTHLYKGNRMDIGGHRFFTKNHEVQELWHEILKVQGAPSSDDLLLKRDVPLATGGPDPEKEDEIMLSRHRISRILYLHKFFDYPISLKWQTFKNMGFSRTMKASFGYLGSAVHKRKELSLADFYINRFGKPLYRMFFEDYTKKVWGRDPKEISPDWGAQRVKGLSLWKAISNVITKPFHKKNVETSLIERFEYPKYGPGFLYETMAKRIEEMGGEILFNHRVKKVNLSDNQVTSLLVETPAGDKEISGSYFFSSMPLKDLYLAIGNELVPNDVFEIATHLVYRDFITVGVLAKKLLLKNTTKEKTINDLVPDTWIYIQEREVKIGRLQIFNNWSPYLVKDPLNSVWIGLEYFANEGDELWEMPEEEFKNFAINELSSIGVIDPNDVIDATELKVKKAYPAYFDTYKDIAKVREHLLTIKNLYCIGRNGQHRYNNMDHSMLTAIQAVRSLLDPSKYPPELIWEVNTEQDYAEEKK